MHSGNRETSERRARGLVWFAGIAAVLLAILFRDALLHGHVLGQADFLFSMPPWDTHRPPGWRIRNPLLGDVPLVFYPFLYHARAAILNGDFPLWSSAMGAGTPFFATFQSAMLSPFTAIAYVLPFPAGFTVNVASRLLVGGLGMYLFLRALSLSVGASVFGGIAFLLNPFSIVWLEHPLSAVAAWLPWMLLAVEYAVAGGARRSIAGFAIASTLTLLAGHPETAFKVFLLVGAYALYRARASRNASRFLTLIACGGLLGALLSSIQIIPFLEYANVSRVLAERSGVDRPLFAVPPASFVTTFIPSFYGTPLGPRFVLGSGNYCEQQVYPGIVAWAFAPMALLHRRLRGRALFFLGAAVVAYLIMYGTVVSQAAILLLPPLRVAVLARFGLLAITGIVIAAAIGADAVFSGDAQGRPHSRAAFATVATASAVAIAIVVLGFLLVQRDMLTETRQWTQTLRATTRGAELLALAVGCVCVASWVWPRGAVVLAVGLISVDLLRFADGFHPAMPRELVFPPVAALETVRQDPSTFRVVGWQRALLPNTSLIYGFQDVRSYDGIGHRNYSELLQTGFAFNGSSHELGNVEAAPLLDLLNVKYVLTSGDTDLPSDRFDLVHKGAARLYRNRHPNPRAFLADANVVLGREETLRAIRDGTVDLARVAILDRPLGSSLEPDRAANALGTADLTQYEDEIVTIETEADGRRLLVLSDIHYPGWRATVDSVEVPIRQANHAFRAISVPAGRHHVVFQYRPASFLYGAILSAIGLIALIFLLIPSQPRLLTR